MHKKPITQRGIAHIGIILVIVIGIAIAGGYWQVRSHADQVASDARYNSNFHKLKGADLAHAKKIASDQWGGNVCGKDGAGIKIVWYSASSYFKKLAQVRAPEFGDPNPQAQLELSHNSLAYAFNNAAYSKSKFIHCKVFMNSSIIKRDYKYNAHPYLNLNSAEFECTILVHEVGHLRGFYSVVAYTGQGKIDHHHSPDRRNIMYGGGTQDVINTARFGASRCLSEF